MFLFITETHSMGKITSIPFTLVSKLKCLSSASPPPPFPSKCESSYFIAGKSSSVFISFSAMFPGTSKKFFIGIPYWIKVSTCDALCHWWKSLHHFSKEYRIFFLTLGLLWSLSWLQFCCSASYSAFNFSFIISEGSKLKSGRPTPTWS